MTDSVLTSRHLWQMPVDDVLPEPNERIDIFAPSGPTATRDHDVAVVLLAIASIYWVGSLLAVIFGHVALNRIDGWNGWVGGKGMVTVAIVLGYVGLGCLAFVTFRGIWLGLSGRRSRTAPAV